jgi:F0F1-type ATP synthase assembly protein I
MGKNRRIIMKKFIEKKLVQIGDIGCFIGQILRKFFRTTSKGMIAVGILFIFGFAVWGIIDGMNKRSGK